MVKASKLEKNEDRRNFPFSFLDTNLPQTFDGYYNHLRGQYFRNARTSKLGMHYLNPFSNILDCEFPYIEDLRDCVEIDELEKIAKQIWSGLEKSKKTGNTDSVKKWNYMHILFCETFIKGNLKNQKEISAFIQEQTALRSTKLLEDLDI